MKKVFSLLLVVALMASLVVGCGGGDKPADEGEAKDPIRIGALEPFSGANAALGAESFRGLEIAVNAKNKAGGIAGRQIELVKADLPDVTAAVSEADRLINQEGLKILFGTYGSSLAYAASEVAERNGVIYFETTGIADNITSRNYKYLLRTCPMASSFGIGAVQFIRDTLAPKMGVAPSEVKISVIGEDSMYGSACGDAAEAEAAKNGMKVVSRYRYNAKTNDLSSIVLKLKQDDPDFLIHTSYITDTILFFRQAKELGLNKIKAYIGQGGGYALQDFADSMGNDVNGIFNVDYPQPDLNPAAAKGIDTFLALYNEAYGSYPKSGHSLVNYQGALVLFEILEKTGGDDDPDKVREAARQIDIAEGTTPSGYGCKFTDDPAMAGQNERAFALTAQWQNGKQVTVGPEKYASVSEIIFPQPAWGSQ